MDLMTTARALYLSTRYTMLAKGSLADWAELTGLTFVALSRDASLSERMRRTTLMNVGQVNGKLGRMRKAWSQRQAGLVGLRAVKRELGV